MFEEAKVKSTTTERLLEITTKLKPKLDKTTKGGTEYNAIYAIFITLYFHPNSTDELVAICNIPGVAEKKEKITQREAIIQ